MSAFGSISKYRYKSLLTTIATTQKDHRQPFAAERYPPAGVVSFGHHST